MPKIAINKKMQNQEPQNKQAVQPPTKPADENLGILVQDHIRIFDPNNQQLYYRGRG
jgi:hypothetical protein